MKRESLAAIAETLAAKPIIGEKSNAGYMKMLKYYLVFNKWQTR